MTTEHVSVPREFLRHVDDLILCIEAFGAAQVPLCRDLIESRNAILSRATPSDDKTSAPREATDAPSFERWYWSQIQNPLATAYNNPLGIPTDGNLHDAAKWGWDACRKSFATSLPAAVQDGEVRLWDTQWMSIVNHDNCYRDWSKDDAIAHAVKMTEQAIARNVADGKLPPKKTAAAPQAGES